MYSIKKRKDKGHVVTINQWCRNIISEKQAWWDVEKHLTRVLAQFLLHWKEIFSEFYVLDIIIVRYIYNAYVSMNVFLILNLEIILPKM